MYSKLYIAPLKALSLFDLNTIIAGSQCPYINMKNKLIKYNSPSRYCLDFLKTEKSKKKL